MCQDERLLSSVITIIFIVRRTAAQKACLATLLLACRRDIPKSDWTRRRRTAAASHGNKHLLSLEGKGICRSGGEFYSRPADPTILWFDWLLCKSCKCIRIYTHPPPPTLLLCTNFTPSPVVDPSHLLFLLGWLSSSL